MTAPSLYQQEMAKRNPLKAQRDAHNVNYYLTHTRKVRRWYLTKEDQAARDQTWAEWYRQPMTCDQIAQKWQRMTGQKCYSEKVRRALSAYGVVLRPRGSRHGIATAASRIAVLEQRVEALLERVQQLEAA